MFQYLKWIPDPGKSLHLVEGESAMQNAYKLPAGAIDKARRDMFHIHTS